MCTCWNSVRDEVLGQHGWLGYGFLQRVSLVVNGTQVGVNGDEDRIECP